MTHPLIALRSLADGPVLPLPKLGATPPVLLAFGHLADLAIVAYEKEPTGKRVHRVRHDSAPYWIPRITPVLAGYGGWVIDVYPDTQRGTAVILGHGDDYFTCYFGLERAFVTTWGRRGVPQRIETGHPIGQLAASHHRLRPLQFQLLHRSKIHGLDSLEPIQFMRHWRIHGEGQATLEPAASQG